MAAAAAARQNAETAVVEQQATGAHLSHWITFCLLVWVALDVLPRFFPLEWLHILPEHIATRHPGKFYPFSPDLRLHSERWMGETAMEGNLTPTETRPPIDFSVDSLGFRLTPGVPPGGKVDLLLFSGASFAYGGGLSDSETFPAVFTHETGSRMYNGGHFWWDPQDFASLDWLVAKFHGQRPVIVLLEWEQYNHNVSDLDMLPWKTDRIGERLVGESGYRKWKRDVKYARRYLTAIWNISPLEVLSIRAFKALSNDKILPNRYRASVAPFQTARGDRLLFLQEEVARVADPPSQAMVERNADYFAAFQQRLAERQLRAYVLLIPNKYTLYGGLVDPAAPKAGGARYLDRLEAALKRRGIAVVNGLTALEPYAAGDLASGQFSMYREDHHWSPKGVRILAGALAGRLRADGILNGNPTPHAVQ